MRSLLYTHRRAFEKDPSSPIPGLRLKNLFQRSLVSLRAYDELITTKLYGFHSADDYYATISSIRFISKIRVPFLGINAMDDPIVGSDTLPICEALTNPWTILVRTGKGGHLGWYEQASDGSLRRWYVTPVYEYLGAMISVRVSSIQIVATSLISESLFPAVQAGCSTPYTISRSNLWEQD